MKQRLRQSSLSEFVGHSLHDQLHIVEVLQASVVKSASITHTDMHGEMKAVVLEVAARVLVVPG